MTEELPEGWAWAKIGEVCEVNPRRFDNPPEEDDLLSFVPMASVEAETGILDASQTKIYGEVKRKSLTPFQENDVIFSKITPCMENGKIALAEGLKGGRAVGSTEFMVLRCGSNLNPKYLLYFLLQDSFRKEAERNMAGAVGHRRVPKGFISASEIPIPPLGEQGRIVAALESELSRLSAAARHVKRSIGLLGVLEKSIRGRALDCEGKVVQGKIGDLLDRIEAGKSFACEARPAQVGEWGVVKVSAMTWGEFREDENKAISAGRIFDPSDEIRSGDILVSRANTREYVGAPVLVSDVRGKLLLSDKSLRLVPRVGVDKDWLIQVLASPHVRGQISDLATGTKDSMRNISQKTLMGVEVTIPEYSRQRELASSIGDSLRDVSRFKDAILVAQARSEQLSRSLLAAAFAGKLVPQDPSDEPAFELLGRIRAEQAAVTKPKRGRRAKTSQSPNPIPEDSRPVPAGEQTALEI